MSIGLYPERRTKQIADSRLFRHISLFAVEIAYKLLENLDSVVQLS